MLRTKHSWTLCLLVCLQTIGSSARLEPTPKLISSQNVLTNAAEVRAISSVEANHQYPVKLRAVITALNPSSIFLQDYTGGTFITMRANPTNYVVGTVLDVEGVTFVGRFVPGITAAHIQAVGRAELPAAVPVNFDDLLSARWHYTRVEVRGIVHSVTPLPEGGRYVLGLAMGSRKLEVQIAATGTTNLAALVDARIRIDGLAAGYINDRRQLVSPQLLVSRLEDLHVEAPPLADPFKAPLTDAAALLNFSPAGVSKHRLHVRGIVTHWLPGEVIFLRDGERGLLVQTVQKNPVNSGDIIEAVGFPAMGRFSAFLEDAEFSVVGHGPAPRPVVSTVAEALNGTHDANLISMKARVLEVLENPDETVLVLSADTIPFHARMPRRNLALHKGSIVHLTGVCRVEEFNITGGGFGANPRSFELLLRSPADVEVLTSPSWWTTQRLAYTAAILLGLALTAFVWIAMLRRRVAEQATIIRIKVHREAMLEERHRVAREMHDTLAQSFSGLGFQLDALDAHLTNGTDGARNQLETARKIIRQGQEDFRRSLFNLRAEELERATISEALPAMARQMIAGTGIELRCEIHPLPRRLTEAAEGNILRISQECVTNAIRHAHPKHIDLKLQYELGEVRLRIADDGVGFDPAGAFNNGHFGLRGMQERADQIGAKLHIASQPGRGTTVTVTLLIPT